MWLEELLLLGVIGLAIFFVGIPFVKLVNHLIPKKRNPVAEAQEKLQQAKLELEATKLAKETEQIYSTLYDEVLNETDKTNQQERKHHE